MTQHSRFWVLSRAFGSLSICLVIDLLVFEMDWKTGRVDWVPFLRGWGILFGVFVFFLRKPLFHKGWKSHQEDENTCERCEQEDRETR